MSDVRLALGYTALVVAAACFTWDYKLGWEATKLWTACAVGFYAALNGALTIWVWLVEEGTIYQGLAPEKAGGDKVSLFVASSAKKGEPTYHLKVAIIDKNKNDIKAFEFSTPFTAFFNEAGYFVAEPFQGMLVKNISVVAKSDTKRAAAVAAGTAPGRVEETKPTETQALLDENPELLDAVLEAQGQATGTEKKKGGKRRKA